MFCRLEAQDTETGFLEEVTATPVWTKNDRDVRELGNIWGNVYK